MPARPRSAPIRAEEAEMSAAIESATSPSDAPAGSAIPGNVEGALQDMTVPAYAIDRFGIIRWLNPAAVALIGDVRGHQQSSVVAPEQARTARESFTRKVLGTEASTDAEVVLVDPIGRRI